MSDHDTTTHGDANRDPITDEKGAHPVGAGLGAAAGGAATGAAVGTVAGPVGTAIGVIAGGLIGGLAGKGVAEAVDPTEEDAYWRDEHKNRTRDYYKEGSDYDTHYKPAHQYGWESYAKSKHENGEPHRFEDLSPRMQQEWNEHRSDGDLTWEEAHPAVRDGYNRAHEKQSA